MNTVNRFCLKKVRYSWFTAAVLTLSLLHPATVTLALPVNGQVTAGQATVSTPTASSMHIVQESNKAIINWNSFGIGRGESINITQPNTQSTLLNRVLGNNASQIYGSLTANGQVFLVNPNGVLFAPEATVNVGGLVASTLAIKDSDFLSQKYTFFKNGASGSMINQGTLTAGFIALLSGSTNNTGSIITSRGLAAIAAGEMVTLGFDPYGLIAIKVDQATYNAHIKNSGVIESDGGAVIMSTSAADELLATVVNNSGKVRSGNIIIETGTFINSGTMDAGGKVDVTATGTMINTGILAAAAINANVNNLIDAGTWNTAGNATGGNIAIHALGSIEQTSASQLWADGENGGDISITAGHEIYLSGALNACGSTSMGGNIRITAPETILAGIQAKADGSTGGGLISIGGGWQGKDITLANALNTVVTSSSSLNANALDNGNGGKIVLWSDKSTTFAGTIEAKGGANSGNGGKVEVSSHDLLTFNGRVTTSAAKGESGLLLLDPRNITIDANPAAPTFYLIPLLDSNPGTGDQHGSGKILELLNGNIIVSSPFDNVVAVNAGAVRLYKPDGTLISILTGSTANDMVGSRVNILTNNNNAVTATATWSNVDQANAGAVTWINGNSGTSGTVSALNSLVGSLANDGVGTSVTALTNGNYVVGSPHWNSNTGAATWASGATDGTRLTGPITVVNSLTGSSINDLIGANVTALTNGNYVVSSGYWDKVNTDNTIVIEAGAVTWGNGLSGTTGTVSALNSLVGSSKNDFVGSNDSGSNNVTALGNGNYVVSSGFWDNGKASNAGAVTWGDGLGSTIGAVNQDNSLVGSKSGNQVGWGPAAITLLSNGNYVVTSGLWDNGTATNAGAVTWANGLGGTVGVISPTNSLVGSTKNDCIGSDDAASNNVKALTNGNYVVNSKYWDNGSTADVGAVTWGCGLGGTVGTVSGVNSLIGTLPNDGIGSTVTALANGNYVVASPNWNNAAGAVTWGNGETGGIRLIGTVLAENSLIGSLPNDGIGSTVTALTNGNYVVSSPNWNNGAGAVTWGNGETGGIRLIGTVSAENSLIGSTANDNIGRNTTILTNGNYVVSSGNWDKVNTDNTVVIDAGAVTWGSGLGGTVGTITGSNSLIGSSQNDYAGSDVSLSNNVIALTNGNYVVSSKYWDNNKAVNAGSVTWGSGLGGTVGAISITNSLVGSKTGNQVGNITGLPNGNYVVTSPLWDNSAATNAGAVTFGNGLGGTTGSVTSLNSMVGISKEDQVGSGGIIPLLAGNLNGCFIISSPAWLNNTGRVDILTPVPLIQKYSSYPGADNTFTPNEITSLLNAGENVILMANNDITVNSSILSNNPISNSGNLSLNAGRSILLNAGITTKNGNLTLIANDTKANGVIDAYRDAGNAAITMAAGSSINTGSGNVTIELRNGAGKTYNESGDITLRNITAGTISAVNYGLTTGSGITLADGTLAAQAISGSSIVLAGKDFDNSAATTLSTAGTARWIVYADNPGATIKGGLVSDFRHYNTSYNNYLPEKVSESGNGFIYNAAPGNISVSTSLASGSSSSTYGTTPTATFGYTLSSSDNEDNIGNIGLTGTMKLTGVPTASSNAGSYTISYGGGFSSTIGLTFTAGTGITYTVDKRAVNISANALSKTYGNADQTLTWQAETQTGNRGFITGDSFTGALERTAGENIGIYTINQGTLGNSNYAISYTSNGLTINPRPITLSATATNKIYGETDPKLAVDISSGSLGSLSVSDALIDVTGTLSRQTGNIVGSYDIALGSGKKAVNYGITFDTDNNAFSIIKRPIVISADPKSKTYSVTDPKLTWQAESKSTARGLLSGDSFSGTLGRIAGENVGDYAITQGSVDNNNYAISFIGADLTINPRPITLHATVKNKVYGEPDPTLAVSITSGTLGSITVSDMLSDLTGTLTRETGSDVGTYDIALGAGTKTGNYAVTFVTDNNAFSITQRPITISADTKNKTYSDADPVLTWQSNAPGTGKGLVEGDSITGVLERTEGENAGIYIINEGTLANSNYKISYSSAKFTIDKRLLTLSAIKTYDGGTSLTGFVTLGNLAEGETLNYTGATSKNKEVTSNATNYINAITLLDGTGVKENYKLPTLNVSNAPVTINARPEDIIPNNGDGVVVPDKTLPTNVDMVKKTIVMNNSKELFEHAIPFTEASSIATPDLPELRNSIWSPSELSLSRKSGNTPATKGFKAVKKIEAYEPVLSFFILPIPPDTFRHNNPDAVVSVQVNLVNGSVIPSWMSFDPKQNVLSGTPPQHAQGEYRVELIAKDQFGSEARTVLLVKVG